MTIRRTYFCENCEHEFTIECESNSPDPVCSNPDCDKVMEWRPKGFAIGGSIEGKAVAHTQQILEQDYGLSNFKDNAREGETGIIRRQETKVETELVEREVREMTAAIQADPQKTAQFWGNNAGAPTGITSMTGQSLIAMAKQGPSAVDPMAMLHQGVKKGKIPTPQQMMRIEARADIDNPARKAKGS